MVSKLHLLIQNFLKHYHFRLTVFRANPKILGGGAENEGNPYDANGYYHNLNLDYIFANIGTDSSNLNIYNKSIAYLTSEFGSSVSGSVSSAMPSNSSLVTGVFGFVDDLSISAYQTGIGGLPVRTVVKNVLFDLLVILTDTSKAYAGDFSDLKSEIISWENGLSISLTNSEKQSLLRAGAVARYSLLYWSYYDKTLWGFLRWLGWGLVAAADAIGFGVGSSACGPYCGIALGGGASFLGFKIFKARGWEP